MFIFFLNFPTVKIFHVDAEDEDSSSFWYAVLSYLIIFYHIPGDSWEHSQLWKEQMSHYHTLGNYYIVQFWWIMWTLWSIFDVWFKHFTATCYHHQGSIFLWNVGTLLPTYATSQNTKPWFGIMTSSLSYVKWCFLHLTIL